MKVKPDKPITASEAGKKGAKQRWRGTTKAERSKAMRQVALVRWAMSSAELKRMITEARREMDREFNNRLRNSNYAYACGKYDGLAQFRDRLGGIGSATRRKNLKKEIQTI